MLRQKLLPWNLSYTQHAVHGPVEMLRWIKRYSYGYGNFYCLIDAVLSAFYRETINPLMLREFRRHFLPGLSLSSSGSTSAAFYAVAILQNIAMPIDALISAVTPLYFVEIC